MTPAFDRWRAAFCFVLGVAFGLLPALLVVIVPVGILRWIPLWPGVEDAVAGAVSATAMIVILACGVAVAAADRHIQVADYRSKRRACLGCGYSLRHLPPSTGHCPECGRIFRRP